MIMMMFKIASMAVVMPLTLMMTLVDAGDDDDHVFDGLWWRWWR